MPPRPSHFDKAKRLLSGGRAAKLEALLREWDTDPDIASFAASNLRSEHGSPVQNVVKYLARLIAKRTSLTVASPTLGTEFQARGAKFTLEGHPATRFRTGLLGRAILLEKYVGYLQESLDALGCYDTEDDIRDNLRQLDRKTETTAPKRLQVYFPAIKQTLLGKGTVFATFAFPFDPNREPWVRPSPSAQEVRDGIALGDDPANKEYLLFTYRLPSAISPRVPTTASSGWSYQRYFRPSPSAVADRHGWTHPLTTGVAKWPEIVHSEINGETLHFPFFVANP